MRPGLAHMETSSGPSPQVDPATRASVCVVTHNGEAYLHEQLASVAAQLTDQDEVVILDNASSDGTRSIIARFQRDHRRTVVELLDRNLGIVRGLERAIRRASGRYVFFCDQDDVWKPGRLEAQIAGLQDADLSVCNAALVDQQLSPLGKTIFDVRRPRLGWSNLRKNAFVGCSMAMTRSALLPLLPFPEHIPMHDWYIAQESYKRGYRLHVAEEILFLYRRHGGNASATGSPSARPLARRLLDRLRLLRHTF